MRVRRPASSHKMWRLITPPDKRETPDSKWGQPRSLAREISQQPCTNAIHGSSVGMATRICGHPLEHWPGAAPWDWLRPLYHAWRMSIGYAGPDRQTDLKVLSQTPAERGRRCCCETWTCTASFFDSMQPADMQLSWTNLCCYRAMVQASKQAASIG